MSGGQEGSSVCGVNMPMNERLRLWELCDIMQKINNNGDLTMTKILFVCHGRISPNFEKSLCL